MKDKKTDFSLVVEKRSILPRRENIASRLKAARARHEAIESDYKIAIQKSQIKIAELEEIFELYKYPTSDIEIIARAENLPAVAGIYAITCNGQEVYIGESQDVQKRCVIHAKAILKNAPGLSVYKALHLRSSKDIGFLLLKSFDFEDNYSLISKKARIIVEGEYCNAAINRGCVLFNKTWAGQERGNLSIEEINELRESNGTVPISVDQANVMRQTMSLRIMLEHFHIDDDFV